jgi:hypothetical protein
MMSGICFEILQQKKRKRTGETMWWHPDNCRISGTGVLASLHSSLDLYVFLKFFITQAFF